MEGNPMIPSPYSQGHDDATAARNMRGAELYTHPLARAAYRKGYAQGVDASLADPAGLWSYTEREPEQ